MATGTLDITSGYLTIQKVSQKLEITRGSHWRKHSSVLLRFTFKIHKSLFYVDYIWYVVVSSYHNDRTGNANFFSFKFGDIKASETTTCALGTSTTILSGRQCFFITRQQGCQAIAARAGWHANNFLSGKSHILAFWQPVPYPFLRSQRMFQKYLDIPSDPPLYHHPKQDEENWWSKDSFRSKLMRPSECIWLVGEGQV